MSLCICLMDTYNLTFQGFSALEGQEKNTFFLDRIATFATLIRRSKTYLNR